MGVIYQGILGAISGKVGPVVGGSWKGIAYLRGYQATVAQPNTAGQVAQKTRMRVAVEFAQAFLTTVIKPLNDRWAVHMSGYNAWISRNIGFISAGGVPSYADFVFSQGTLTGFDTLAATSLNGDPDIDFTWIDNTGIGTALSSDEFYAAAVNATQSTYGSVSAAQNRANQSDRITLSAPCATGNVIHTYSSFRSASGFSVSTSEYLQVVTV